MVDTSKILVDSDIDSLMDDWLVRDGETFTHVRKTGRVGWEELLEEGDSYSAYLLEAPTQEDLIKRAYTLARDMILVMDPPFKFHVKISPGMDSYTDGKTVCVSTQVFDDPELTTGEKLDTFLGYAVHEGAHLLYTDFGVFDTEMHPIVKTLFNILEDERIEMLVGDQYPGFANFIEKVKYYVFDQFYLDYIVPKEKAEALTPFDRLMNCILHIIRYPKYLNEVEIIEFGHYLLEIKKVVLPYPTDSISAVDVAKKIFEIIKEFYVATETERAKKTEGAEGIDVGSGAESTAEIEAKAKAALDADSKEMVSTLEEKLGSPKSLKGLSESDAAKKVLDDKGLLGEVCEGVVEIGSSDSTFFSKAAENEWAYKDSANRVKQYVPAISKILKSHCKEYKLIHKGMRSGVLDTNKLAEAYQGVPTVYLREGEVTTDRISVCVLLDESGSMCGDRISAAKDAAVLINEAVGTIPGVELFIYGHTGDIKRDISTEISIYREKGYTPKFSLGSVTARCENRDGVAILEVAKRVRKQTKYPVLMFVLSDGAPCAGAYRGADAMKHVKECVTKVEKMAFDVIQVCINASYDPSRMFRNFIIMEDMSTLAVELAKVIKRLTLRTTKSHVY